MEISLSTRANACFHAQGVNSKTGQVDATTATPHASNVVALPKGIASHVTKVIFMLVRTVAITILVRDQLILLTQF